MGSLTTLLLLSILALVCGELVDRHERRSAAGPVTLLVHNRRLGRHQNSNSSNIHDYFRHVFIRKNDSTGAATPDTAQPEHIAPATPTTTATATTATKANDEAPPSKTA